MKMRWKEKGAREEEEQSRYDKELEKESKAGGEQRSVVTGAQSENSNLVITAHCCLHGKEGRKGG